MNSSRKHCICTHGWVRDSLSFQFALPRRSAPRFTPPFSPLLSSLYLVAEGVQERGDAGDVVIATGEGAAEHGHHADGVAVGGGADGGGRGGLGGLEDEGAR